MRRKSWPLNSSLLVRHAVCFSVAQCFTQIQVLFYVFTHEIWEIINYVAIVIFFLKSEVCFKMTRR